MGLQLGTFDKRATWLDDTADVVRLIQQLAGSLNGGISRPCRARPWQSTRLCEDDMPHHWAIPSLFCASDA
jgi:hypothetical protein